MVYSFFVCDFENRSRSGMRKSLVERYRNFRVNWLLLKKRDRNWRERFGNLMFM